MDSVWSTIFRIYSWTLLHDIRVCKGIVFTFSFFSVCTLTVQFVRVGRQRREVSGGVSVLTTKRCSSNKVFITRNGLGVSGNFQPTIISNLIIIRTPDTSSNGSWPDYFSFLFVSFVLLGSISYLLLHVGVRGLFFVWTLEKRKNRTLVLPEPKGWTFYSQYSYWRKWSQNLKNCYTKKSSSPRRSLLITTIWVEIGHRNPKVNDCVQRHKPKIKWVVGVFPPRHPHRFPLRGP